MSKKEKLGQEPVFYVGMSKRFYVACMAMQGLISNKRITEPGDHIVKRYPATDRKISAEEECQEQITTNVKMAYMIVDEMLKQKNKYYERLCIDKKKRLREIKRRSPK